MTDAPTCSAAVPANRCGQCVHWAPILGRKFLGICGNPERAPGQCTDRLDTCIFATAAEVPVETKEEFLA